MASWKSSHASPKIVVVGSLNVDLAAQVRQLPRPGETIAATGFHVIAGGKGANQAVSAARMGAEVSMIGRLGDDVFAKQLTAAMQGENVNLEYVASTADCSSGVAMICVADSGQNTIVVAPGANGRLTPEDVEAAQSAIVNADLVLLQLEIPQATVLATMRLARRLGKPVLLNAAPAPQDWDERLLAVDLLCVNETEAQRLTGFESQSLQDAQRAARSLHQRGAGSVVITLGERGAMICNRDGECTSIPAFRVHAVDTTAAGDAFVGALAVALCQGRELADAARLGCAAGALAASRFGAQTSLPREHEVREFSSRTMPAD